MKCFVSKQQSLKHGKAQKCYLKNFELLKNKILLQITNKE